MLEPVFRLSYILVLQTVRMLSLSNAVPDTQLVIKGRHYELSFYLLTRLPDHLLVAYYKSPTTQQRSTPGDEVAHDRTVSRRTNGRRNRRPRSTECLLHRRQQRRRLEN